MKCGIDIIIIIGGIIALDVKAIVVYNFFLLILHRWARAQAPVRRGCSSRNIEDSLDIVANVTAHG